MRFILLAPFSLFRFGFMVSAFVFTLSSSAAGGELPLGENAYLPSTDPLVVLDLDLGGTVQTALPGLGPVEQMLFDAAGRRIVSLAGGVVTITDLESQVPVTLPNIAVEGFALSPDEQNLLLLSLETIQIWDFGSLTLVGSISLGNNSIPVAALATAVAPLLYVVTPGTATLPQVLEVSLALGRVTNSVQLGTNRAARASSIVAAPDSSELYLPVFGADDGSPDFVAVIVREPLTFATTIALPGVDLSGGDHKAIHMSKDGGTLFVGGSAQVAIVDIATRTMTGSFPTAGPVRGIDVNSTGRELFVLTDDGDISVYEIATSVLGVTLPVVPGGIAGTFFGGFISPLRVVGQVEGQTLLVVQCENMTTGQIVLVKPFGATNRWGCEDQGLDIGPSHLLRTTILSTADPGVGPAVAP